MRNDSDSPMFGRYLPRILAVLCGGVSGGAAWGLPAGAAGLASVAANPQDPSAGAWVIVLHLATPPGCVVGMRHRGSCRGEDRLRGSCRRLRSA